MSAAQNTPATVLSPEIREIVEKARKYGPDFVTQYESQLLTKFYERYLDGAKPTEPVVDLSVCTDELCSRRCELSNYSFTIDYTNLKLCSNRMLVGEGSYYVEVNGVKLGMCRKYGSATELTANVVRLAKQIHSNTVKKRPSKTTKSGFEYVKYCADIYIPLNREDAYEDHIWIEDFMPRRFAASLLTYLTLYGYYSPPILT